MQDLSESMAAAEGAAGAEQAGRSGEHKNCLNCGTELKGEFCHACGQKDLPKRQTTFELLANFVSSFSNYEGKFILTVKYLFLRPGALALEYNAGHRERYFHPVRMYAFISFVFFLIYFSLPEEKKDKVELTEEDKKELRDSLNPKGSLNKQMAAFGVDTVEVNFDSLSRVKPDSTSGKKKRNNFNLTNSKYKTIEAYDSAQAALPEEKRDNWFEQRLNHRNIILKERYKDDDSKDFNSDFWKATQENFPKLLFLLLPVFALVLKLLYVRRNYFYSEHLVFSIYYYNFFFFAGSIMLLVGLVESLDWMVGLIGWGIYLYLLFSMKKMYGQAWGKTILKFVVFSFVFSFLCLIGVGINLLIILMIL